MGLETKPKADFNLTLDFYAIEMRKQRRMAVQGRKERKHRSEGLPHLYLYPSTRTPFLGAGQCVLKVGVQ